MIARRFAMDHPDRLWALGVLHSAHRRDPAAQEAIRKRADLTAIEGPAATVEAALARWLSDEFREKHPNTTKAVLGACFAWWHFSEFATKCQGRVLPSTFQAE